MFKVEKGDCRMDSYDPENFAASAIVLYSQLLWRIFRLCGRETGYCNPGGKKLSTLESRRHWDEAEIENIAEAL